MYITGEQFHSEYPSYFMDNKFRSHTLKIAATSPRGQWVNTKFVINFINMIGLQYPKEIWFWVLKLQGWYANFLSLKKAAIEQNVSPWLKSTSYCL